MAKKRWVTGTGITARTVTAYSGEDLVRFVEDFARQWNAAIREGRGTFGAVCLEAERAYGEILRRAGEGPFEADSLEDFAQRILRHIDVVRAAIAGKDADRAARYGVGLGCLLAEAEIKEVWESHALRGQKNAARLNEGARTENKKRSHAAKKKQQQWQAMTDHLQKTNKRLKKKSPIARIIAAKIGGNPDTIRRNIKLR